MIVDATRHPKFDALLARLLKTRSDEPGDVVVSDSLVNLELAATEMQIVTLERRGMETAPWEIEGIRTYAYAETSLLKRWTDLACDIAGRADLGDPFLLALIDEIGEHIDEDGNSASWTWTSWTRNGSSPAPLDDSRENIVSSGRQST